MGDDAGCERMIDNAQRTNQPDESGGTATHVVIKEPMNPVANSSLTARDDGLPASSSGSCALLSPITEESASVAVPMQWPCSPLATSTNSSNSQLSRTQLNTKRTRHEPSQHVPNAVQPPPRDQVPPRYPPTSSTPRDGFATTAQPSKSRQHHQIDLQRLREQEQEQWRKEQQELEQEQAEEQFQTLHLVKIRALESQDIDQLRQLHEDWFPIRYNQGFYDGAARGVWTETNTPLFTRVVVEPDDRQEQDIGAVGAQDPTTLASPSGKQLVLGAVIANISPVEKSEDKELLEPNSTHTEVMYILTLGSRRSVRRRGVASVLLQECIEEAQRNEMCGAVYLHVKADNIAAIRFYEKNGFQNLKYLEDYYLINGVRHHAYLYIRYVNGASAPSGWLDVISRPFVTLISLASWSWRRLTRALTYDDVMPSKDTMTRSPV